MAAGCAVLGIPHGGLGEGIRNLLGALFDSVVLVGDERSLLACLAGLRPDLLLLDVALAPGRAFALTARLHAAHRGLRILLLVSDDSAALRVAAREAGANGCLPKAVLGADLVHAVESLLEGGTAFWADGATDGRDEPGPTTPVKRDGGESR